MVFPGSQVSSTNKTDPQDTEILLKVALNIITLTPVNQFGIVHTNIYICDTTKIQILIHTCRSQAKTASAVNLQKVYIQH